jgi:hypothetical protein
MDYHIEIDIDDVVKAGGIDEALTAWCEESDDTSTGVIGPSFATSGPGAGWSEEYDAVDFARRAMEGGKLYYLDLEDGRLASSPEWTEDVYQGQDIEWTDESVVRIECPSLEDAMEVPETAAAMLRAVRDTYYDCSDCGEWLALLLKIKAASEAFEKFGPKTESELRQHA